MTALPKVVVLGGGFAGLEAAFYLRLRAGDDLPITLISDRDYFLFRPHTVYIPFGLDPERLKIPLDPPATRRKILFAVSAAREINPVTKLYRVGVSPAWRLGKRLLGAYMPWRFGDGNPFRAGLPWTGLEAGLKVMSRLLAS